MDGGLTTIEEKSMGAMVKSGTRPIRGVLKIAQAPKKPGLYLLDTTPDEKLEPAHHEAADPSDMLDLIACGAHIDVYKRQSHYRADRSKDGQIHFNNLL